MVAPAVAQRDALESELETCAELLRTLQLLGNLQYARAARLRRCHEMRRCVGVQDLLRAVDALQRAHETWTQAESVARRCGVLLDALRGDGLATVEYAIAQELLSDRASARTSQH